MKLRLGPMASGGSDRCEAVAAPATATAGELHASNGGLVRERHRVELPATGFGWAREELLAFRWFPTRFLRAAPCGDGVTVLQRCRVAPFVSVDAPVRIVESVDKPRRVALTVVTVRGHPERGVERYELVHDPALERVTLTVEKAWELADPLARLAGPFSRWLQAYATRVSLRRFRDGR